MALEAKSSLSFSFLICDEFCFTLSILHVVTIKHEKQPPRDMIQSTFEVVHHPMLCVWVSNWEGGLYNIKSTLNFCDNFCCNLSEHILCVCVLFLVWSCASFCAMAVVFEAARKLCWADMVENGDVDEHQTDDHLSANFGVAKERPSISPPVTTLVFRGLHADACLILYWCLNISWGEREREVVSLGLFRDLSPPSFPSPPKHKPGHNQTLVGGGGWTPLLRVVSP